MYPSSPTTDGVLERGRTISAMMMQSQSGLCGSTGVAACPQGWSSGDLGRGSMERRMLSPDQSRWNQLPPQPSSTPDKMEQLADHMIKFVNIMQEQEVGATSQLTQLY